MRVSVAGGSVWVVAAVVALHAGPAAGRQLESPSGIAIAPSGTVVTVADRSVHRVFDVDLASGAVTVRAGTGEAGFSGDGGSALAARLRNPEWVAYDSRGDLYVADRGNSRVRRVDARTGVIETVVGDGETAYEGDGGAALDASLTLPFGIAIGPADELYVFDTEAHVIRRVDPVSGTIQTVVGNGRRAFAGDGGPGRRASLARPHNGVVLADGTLVFGDSFNQRIRAWDPARDRVRTLAGTGEEGAPEIGAVGSASPFMYFGAMVAEADGSIVFTSLDNRVVRWRARTGRLEAVAGTGERGSTGDGGPATDAAIDFPYGLALLPVGDLIVAEAGSGRLRRIDAETGTITTVTGDAPPSLLDGSGR